MRHWLLVFMIVLLPLRGWAGDVMSVRMASAASQSMPADCPDHVAMAQAMSAPAHGVAPDVGEHGAGPVFDSPATGAHHAAAGCDTCAACQLCHTPAFTAAMPVLASVQASAASPAASDSHYADAEPSRGFKPPIA